MDVRFLVLGVALVLTACGRLEESGSVTRSESKECLANEIPNQYLVQHDDGSIEILSASSDELALEKIRDMATVRFVEPHYSLNGADFVPMAAPAAASGDWGLDAAGFRAAWAKGFTGKGVVVAIVDSGVEISHPQLRQRIFANAAEESGLPGVDDDRNGFVDDMYGYNFSKKNSSNEDISGHGTHVAGIVAADPSSGHLSGAAPDARLMALDFMSYDPEYRQELGNTSDAILAMDYAARNGAKVINASWGGSMCSLSLQAKFNEIQNRDVFVAVAAGNSGVDLSYSPAYPAVYQGLNQITVGALDPTGIRARYSNHGSLVQLLAPGTAVESTVPFGINSSGYAFQSGTSMASPFVAAAAAILREAYPFKSASEIRAALLSSADLYSSPVYPRAKLRVDKALDILGSP